MLCDVCKFEFAYSEELLRHIFKQHANAKNFIYRCTLGECNFVYKKFRQVYNHNSRKHAKQWKKNQSSDSVLSLSCKFCEFKSSTFKGVKTHL